MWTLSKVKRVCYLTLLFFLLLLFFVLPLYFVQIAIFNYILINIIYFITDILKTLLFFNGVKFYSRNKYFEKDDLNIPDEDLPIYSILLPVRKEKDFVMRNLLKSIYNLDYPKEKLDIKLIVDQNDESTLEIAKLLSNDFKFDLIVVPPSNINSKPMSCSYALKFVKGKYLTIYDAEDRPEKYQLKKAVSKFNKLDKNYVCLQASLNYYNKYENFLSYCFSIEYSMWFDFTTTPITKYAAFFPLGGTSNHFKTEKLIELGGWDGYNVTEDAEVAVRIAKAGYKISTLDSITEEEAPITINAWLKQRTRWIKGFMQTFCEHTMLSKPIGIKSNIKFKRIFELRIFDILIYFTFIAMSFLFFILIFAVFFNHVIILQLREFKYLNFMINFNLFTFFFMIYGASLIVIYKNKLKFKPLYFICSPFYWFLHYIASFRAIISLIRSPFYWAKTEHGVSKAVKSK